MTLVRKTGCAFASMASTRASSRDFPRRSACRNDTRMWTESATASVRMMVGEEALTGSSSRRKCPATPTATATDAPITTNVPATPAPERRKKITAAVSAPNMSGMTNGRSRSGDSANAAFSIERPAV